MTSWSTITLFIAYCHFCITDKIEKLKKKKIRQGSLVVLILEDLETDYDKRQRLKKNCSSAFYIARLEAIG